MPDRCDDPMCRCNIEPINRMVKPDNSLNRQVGGNHYKTMKIQIWEIVDALELDFYTGTALKYLLRQKCNRIEDLQKCIHYCERLIELEEQKSNGPH